jgi:large subunit ribosomal protein L18e
MHLRGLIAELKDTARKESAPIWSRIASDLEKPTRQRRAVNVYRLARYGKAGDVVVVPGKVLGSGDINHKLTVAAFTYSQQAADKITKVGGKVMAIADLVKENPKGKNVRIMG